MGDFSLGYILYTISMRNEEKKMMNDWKSTTGKLKLKTNKSFWCLHIAFNIMKTFT